MDDDKIARINVLDLTNDERKKLNTIHGLKPSDAELCEAAGGPNIG